ncbi:MAG: helix-turn-helix domain-containing protein [Patescibacteria group bacterium]|nr:helix-turn-helix domain-containing protein [Patescibacteria group bacterium]
MVVRLGQKIKQKAKLLRKQGYSYGQISKKLNVAKSTLYQWTKNIRNKYKFDKIHWIKKIQPLAIQAIKRKKEIKIKKIIEDTKKEIKKIKINNDMKKSHFVNTLFS